MKFSQKHHPHEKVRVASSKGIAKSVGFLMVAYSMFPTSSVTPVNMEK